jgi:FMN-dependent NADH-azoreductase
VRRSGRWNLSKYVAPEGIQIIHHVSRELQHVAKVLAELIGKCFPFGSLEGAFMAAGGDANVMMFEVNPEQALLESGDRAMKLLHVDSSIFGENSVSRVLSAEVVATQRALHPGIEVTYRDLAADPLGHLTRIHFAGLKGFPPADREGARDLTAGQAALDEFLVADIVVVGAPMYNFSIPSQLKAWIDRLAVPGKTFRYTENGPEGLAGSKRVIVASSCGGFCGLETPLAFLDHRETYLRGLFRFFGITDVIFIRAEGVNVGPGQRAKSVEAARAEIGQLTARVALR